MRVPLLICLASCLAALLPGATSKSLTLPKEMKTCKRGDNTCLIEALRGAVPVLVRGLPKFGIRTIDPMRIDELVFDHGSGPVQIKLTMRNQDLSGLGQVMLTSIQSEMSDADFMLEINGTIPRVGVMGEYSITGKVLVLPITGQGRNNFTYSDLTVMIRMRGKIVKRNGEDFIDLHEFLYDFSTVQFYIDLENLFNGDKALGDNMSVFLNENWKIVIDELKPGIQEAVEQLLAGASKQIFSKVPYTTLFPKE